MSSPRAVRFAIPPAGRGRGSDCGRAPPTPGHRGTCRPGGHAPSCPRAGRAGSATALLALALWLGGCAAPAPPAAPDAADPAASLVGVWCNPTDDGASCWAYDSFEADGRFEACGRTDDDPRPFHGRGRYVVEGRRMCYEVTEATPNFWLGPGARYCTEIVAIDARAHRYRDLDTRAEFRLLRVPAAAKRCPS